MFKNRHYQICIFGPFVTSMPVLKGSVVTLMPLATVEWDQARPVFGTGIFEIIEVSMVESTKCGFWTGIITTTIGS